MGVVSWMEGVVWNLVLVVTALGLVLLISCRVRLEGCGGGVAARGRAWVRGEVGKVWLDENPMTLVSQEMLSYEPPKRY